MTQSVFIDGAVGTTGLEIAERLSGRPEFSLITLPDDRRKDVAARAEALNAADFAILCLPDAAAMEAVAMITNDTTRVIDASSAFRTHPDWTYGFAEFAAGQRDAIRAAMRVSNPGCYPTGFLALIAPLVARGLLPADWPYTLNAVSGYSGGGKALIERFEREGDIGFRSYGLAMGHKHVPEMQIHGGLTHPPLFSPAVIRAYRGMVVEVPLQLAAMDGVASADELRAALIDHYAGETAVRVMDSTGVDEILIREGTDAQDGMDLYVFASSASGEKGGAQVRLIATLDNLCKGASGAAVQNLNLMAGVDEFAGMRL
jgi:N-acetyl-gamma-glutamyl-phosphate reductase